MSGGSRVNKWLWSEQVKKKKEKKLWHSDGEAVHFGANVVALEKDEMFKRVYVHGEYSVHFFPPALSKNAFEGCSFTVKWRRNQCIAASMTMCKYMCVCVFVFPECTEGVILFVCDLQGLLSLLTTTGDAYRTVCLVQYMWAGACVYVCVHCLHVCTF